MYRLERTKDSYRVEPWAIPYERRIGVLKAAKAAGRHTAAFLYPHFDSSTFRYRAYNPLSVIEALGLSNETELDFWFGQTERNCMTAKMCDSMITTNQCLAEHLQEDFGKPCYVLQNYLNWVQEKVSQEYFEAKRALEPEKPFIIGYFSGSPTHEKDLMVVGTVT